MLEGKKYHEGFHYLLNYCQAPLNGQVNDGSVVVEGNGDWGLKQLCVEWFDTDSFLYICYLKLANERPGLKEYDLQCGQDFSGAETCPQILRV